MALRFCPTCAGEVDSIDGFCMLGHSVKLSAPVQSLTQFRAEEKTGSAPAVTQFGAEEKSGSVPVATLPPPPPGSEAPLDGFGRFGRLWRAEQSGPAFNASDPITAFAPQPRMDWGPDRFEGLRRRMGRSKA